MATDDQVPDAGCAMACTRQLTPSVTGTFMERSTDEVAVVEVTARE
jgi:hypothetical protein